MVPTQQELEKALHKGVEESSTFFSLHEIAAVLPSRGYPILTPDYFSLREERKEADADSKI